MFILGDYQKTRSGHITKLENADRKLVFRAQVIRNVRKYN